jgi:hypothetical protein
MLFAKGIFVKLSSKSENMFNSGSYITQDEVEPPKLTGYF